MKRGSIVKGIIFFIAAALIFFSSVSAYSAVDGSANFTFTIGNTVATQTLNGTVYPSNTINTTNFTLITFMLPFGIVPNTVGNCNASSGFSRVNLSYSACTLNITANDSNGQVSTLLLVKLNSSAFSGNTA